MKRTGTKRHGIDQKWHEGLYVQIYNLAREDKLDNDAIATKIGVSSTMFDNWLKQKPHLVECLEEARKPRTSQQEFRAYVYQRLPENLKKLWDIINAWSDHRDAYIKIEALLDAHPIRVRQNLFLYAMVRFNFNISKALKCVNLTRMTLSNWEKEPEFKELLKELAELKGDFFESALIRKVKEGDTSAILFTNRSYNAKRGYNPPKEVNTTLNGTLDHNHTHTGASATLDELPLELRRQILEHLRAKRLGQETIIPDNSSSENGFTPGKLPDKRLKPLDYQSLEDDGTDNRSNSNGEEHSST